MGTVYARSAVHGLMSAAYRVAADDPFALLADQYRQRWRRPTIVTGDVDRAEQWALDTRNGGRSMLTVQGAWRARVIGGKLFVKFLIIRGTWSERINMLSMLRFISPSLPDVDFLYVHSDQDPAPKLGWPCRNFRGCPLAEQVPVFTNAFSGPVRGNPGRVLWKKASLPLPEFTFAGWGRDQPPWCVVGPELEKAAAAQDWDSRIDRAFFAGSLSNGHHRRRLRRLLARNASSHGDDSDLWVHAIDSSFFTFTSKPSRAAARGQRLPLSAACGFRYCLSVPGYGYSSRLRSLLACGCTVIHVRSCKLLYGHRPIELTWPSLALSTAADT